MADYVNSEHPYYAKDGKVWKAATREAGPNGGTKITMGFPVCVMHGAAEGQEAMVAALMNRGDIADELQDALKEAERFLSYFANGDTTFVGAGTPITALAKIRSVIAKADAIP